MAGENTKIIRYVVGLGAGPTYYVAMKAREVDPTGELVHEYSGLCTQPMSREQAAELHGQLGMVLTRPDEDGPAVNTLDRALWRAQRAIDFDHEGIADEDHTILSDMLADLMHWAEAHEVNFEAALLSGQRSHDEELKDWALGATR